jgi:hypothetical protein
MEEQEFRGVVFRKKPPALSREACECAIGFFVKQGQTHLCDVNTCIELAGRVDVMLARSPSYNEGPAVRLCPITPGQIVISARLAEAIKPRVDAVRNELFGATYPPFSSYEDGIAWLKTVEEESLTSAKASTLRLKGELPISYSIPGKEWSELISVPRGSRLVPLAQASREMAQITGFSQASVVVYILAGIAPLLPSVRIHTRPNWNEEFQICRIQVQVEFNSPDVSYDQFRRLYGMLRHTWNVAKEKRLTERDYRILAIVERLGGEPREGQAAFWRKAQQLWNAEEKGKNPPLDHKDWRTTQTKYRRLLKRLPAELEGRQSFISALCRMSSGV